MTELLDSARGKRRTPSAPDSPRPPEATRFARAGQPGVSVPGRGADGAEPLRDGAGAPLPPRPAAAVRWRDATFPLGGRVRASGWLPMVLLSACAVTLVYLVQTSGIATTGYDIQRLQVERNNWTLRNEQLRLELAKRRSLAWVESQAVGRLGMVRPASVTYLQDSAGN